MLIDVPWLLGLNTAAVMAIFSLGTSIGNADFTAGPGGYTGQHRLE